MKTRKTILISSETHEVLSVRLNFREQARPAPAWCQECMPVAPLLTPEEAAPLANLSLRAVCRLVEDGLIHFKETPDGLLLVCLKSLAETPKEI